MSAEARTRILDITRLVSRIGHGPLTGIDRVERAYLRALSARPEPLFLLLRTAFGYLFLPRTAAEIVEQWLATPLDMPAASRGRRFWRRHGLRVAAKAKLRKEALDRALPWRLGRMVTRLRAARISYLNIGHANLTGRTLRQLHLVPGTKISVLIHDTIPLDHPGFSRAGDPDRFRSKLQAVARFADLVICPSQAARGDLIRWCRVLGREPPTMVAPLGIEKAPPDCGAGPPGLDLSRPYFVILGTIEPRKNHALLLHVWETLLREGPATEVPRLYILGSRGWAEAALFRRMEAFDGDLVREVAGLSDGEVARVLRGARALLMPSRAEGFGLPVAEAQALGVPVIAADLPVYREFVGDMPYYLAPDDPDGWIAQIRALARRSAALSRSGLDAGERAALDWNEHFKLVLSVV